ncbi:hypothetical protein [Sorangium sp. So ce128]|uniref:hypothetical protein n=1 Tax=Sorangium sp. So ce128 TaxID=3133281 RepID=UPI003F64234F
MAVPRSLDISKIQTATVFKVYGLFSLYRRLYIVGSFPLNLKRARGSAVRARPRGRRESVRDPMPDVRGDVGGAQIIEKLTP